MKVAQRRSRRSLRQRQRSRRWAFLRVFCMTLWWRCQRLEPSDRFAFACVDVPWCLRSDWPNQHQTSDGLLVHRAYGLCADGPGGGHGFGCEGDAVYMAIYVTMNIGTFAFILSMEKDGQAVTDIGALNQYAKREPGKALAMLILLFSMAGVPPMVGFFGKLYVLRAAYEAGLHGWLWPE